MNSAKRNLTFLILALAIFNTIASQETVYTNNNRMKIGFGLGAAYQQSDIANSRGSGFNFFLGKDIHKKENDLFSFDWKFRILMGDNKAYDHRINSDGTYSNIRYEFSNFDLELGATLNRLREKTRILVSGFAGLGLTHGKTSTNLLDANGNLYDYSVIDPNLGEEQVYYDLKNLSDNEFETKLINKVAVMPTIGIFIGYQISPGFSLGIEHKINFSLKESNSLMGIDIDNKILTDSRGDRNHYTSLSIRWILRSRASRTVHGNTGTVVNTSVTTNNNNTVKPVTNPIQVISTPAPLVEIISPSGSTYSTNTNSLDITARVKNVKGRQDIYLVLNEKNISFEYNPLNGNVSSKLILAEGKNILLITGSNDAGTTSDDAVIYWNKPVTVVKPSVKFIDPSSPVTVEKNVFPINAQTRNVKAWQDVIVTVNGTTTSNFNLSPEGVVTTNIPLKEGVNRVEVKVKNESESASDLATITYAKPVAPVITIMTPSASPFNTFEPLQEIRAKITGVKGKENISLSVNGSNITNFTFDNNSLVLVASLTLKEGSNNIMVTARNNAGQVVKSQVITKEIRPCPPPALKMIEPAQSELLTENRSYTIRTEVKNIVGKEQISIILNNKPITNYIFSGNEISLTASLDSGINSCIIAVKTNCGNEKITYSISYKPVKIVIEKPCLKPVVKFSVSAITREDASHDLKGTASNVKNKSDITVTINDSPYEAFSFVPATGEISAALKLNPGSYTVRVSVKNECGSDSKTAPATVAMPCISPQVNFTVAQVTREDATHDLKGTATNVKNKSDITVTINDSPYEAFSFVPATGEISAALKLNPGSYTVKVSVKNECGSDSKTVQATVAVPCIPPQVNFTVAPVTREDATHDLKGTASNVKNKSDITVTIIDSPYEAFSFVPATGEISAALKLNPGSYTVRVSVKNECGSDSKTAHATVAIPCISPQVNFTVAPVTREDATHDLKGTAGNVKNKSDITVTINDSPYEAFSFVPATGEISAALKLNPGAYTVKVSVKNECGSDSKTAPATVAMPCIPPLVNFTVAPVTREDATHDLKGTASNVKNKSDITVTINDSPYEAFSFVPATGEISAALKLNPGAYTVRVSVKNECGSDSKTAPATVAMPCIPPQVNITLAAVSREDATHDLKGTASNVKNKSDITVTINNSPYDAFSFVPATGEISAALKLNPGAYTVRVSVKNECGSDSKTAPATVAKPCIPPQVNITLAAVSREDASHDLKGTGSNVKNKSDITVTINDNLYEAFSFVPATGEISAALKLNPGAYTVKVSVKNECGSDSKTAPATVAVPCIPPQVNFTLAPVTREDATHDLKGTVSNVKNKSDITVTINDSPYEAFTFTPDNGAINAILKLNPGSSTVKAAVRNECGQNEYSGTVVIEEEKPCGVRINPGNSSSEFCLITPTDTIGRDKLTNNNFRYAGPANSLYFMPIAGGGDAVVKGQPYNLKSGQYYLFTGSLTVTISTKNPGSMGQWSVCISANNEPQTGNGNNRPQSPCETEGKKVVEKDK